MPSCSDIYFDRSIKMQNSLVVDSRLDKTLQTSAHAAAILLYYLFESKQFHVFSVSSK